MGKLIRDRVPERVQDDGGSIECRVLGAHDFERALHAKLLEEAGEVIDATDRSDVLDEIADVREVLTAIAALQGITEEAIVARMAAKRTTHGGFDARLHTVSFEPGDAAAERDGSSRRASR